MGRAHKSCLGSICLAAERTVGGIGGERDLSETCLRKSWAKFKQKVSWNYWRILYLLEAPISCMHQAAKQVTRVLYYKSDLKSATQSILIIKNQFDLNTCSYKFVNSSVWEWVRIVLAKLLNYSAGTCNTGNYPTWWPTHMPCSESFRRPRTFASLAHGIYSFLYTL